MSLTPSPAAVRALPPRAVRLPAPGRVLRLPSLRILPAALHRLPVRRLPAVRVLPRPVPRAAGRLPASTAVPWCPRLQLPPAALRLPALPRAVPAVLLPVRRPPAVRVLLRRVLQAASPRQSVLPAPRQVHRVLRAPVPLPAAVPVLFPPLPVPRKRRDVHAPVPVNVTKKLIKPVATRMEEQIPPVAIPSAAILMKPTIARASSRWTGKVREAATPTFLPPSASAPYLRVLLGFATSIPWSGPVTGILKHAS